MTDTTQPPVEPIFAKIDEIRRRMQGCQSCAERREIIQRWLHGERLQMGGFVPPIENMPRDMSVLMKEK